MQLTLPKFKFTSGSISLKDTLSKMGMSDAFDPGAADFRGMATLSGDENLFISNVFHKAYVSVSETGTEAAAATAVVVEGTTSARVVPPTPVIVTIDHPFVFMIRDVQTGAILFLGRITDPTTTN